MVNFDLKSGRKELMRRNASKYLFFAWTLDRLVQYKIYKNAERINIGYIDKSIYDTGLLKRGKESEEDVNRWLQEMILMGLIRLEDDHDIDQELIDILPKGVEAYKNQTYHVIAAQMMEADESRKMARMAVILAVLSIIITIVFSLLVNCKSI